MDDAEIESLIRDSAAEIPLSSSFTGHEIAQVVETRRKRLNSIGTLLGVYALGAVLTAVTIGLLTSHGSNQQVSAASHHSGFLAPGCGAGGSVNPIGLSSSRRLSVDASAATTINVQLSVKPAVSLSQVQLIVGSPGSILGVGEPSSEPTSAADESANQVLSQTFSTGLSSGTIFRLNVSGIQSGTYPVYAILSYQCEGLGSRSINLVETLSVN